MSLEGLVQTYGYPAVLVGSFLEGETILIIGGFLAHRGYLDWRAVIACAALGSFGSDQLFYCLGRTRGEAWLPGKASWQRHIPRVRALIDSHSLLVVLGCRFMYGLRTVTPFLIGAARLPVARFVPLNAAGALIWASVGTAAGYLFGNALEMVFEDVKRYEHWILAGAGVIGLAAWVVRRRATLRRATRSSRGES